MVLTQSITSFASFEATLEGSILQHTSAVDYYLEKAVHQWSPHPLMSSTPRPAELAGYFEHDQGFWRAFVSGQRGATYGELDYWSGVVEAPVKICRSRRKPRTTPLQVGGASRMEEFLEQDLQNFLQRGPDYRQELASREPAATDGAADDLVLYQQLEEQLEKQQQQPQVPAFASTLYNRQLLPSEFYDASEGSENEIEKDLSAPASPQAARAAAAAAAALLVSTPRSGAGSLLPVGALGRSAATGSPFWAAVPQAADAKAQAGSARGVLGSSCSGPGYAPPSAAAVPAVGAVAQEIEAVPTCEPATAAAEQDMQQSDLEVTGEVAAGSSGAKQAATAATAACGSTVPPFPMEDDEAIAKQKVATQKKLAALEAAAAAGGSEGPAGVVPGKVLAGEEEEGEEMASSSKARGLPTHKDLASSAANSGAVVMDPAQVPARPKPWHMGQAAARSYAPTAKQVLDQSRFFKMMLYGFLACLLLLPMLWAQESWAVQGGSLKSQALLKLQQCANYIFLPLVPLLLLYPSSPAWSLRTTVLHFEDGAMERDFLGWLNAGKVKLDALFHVLWFIMGSCIWARMKHGEMAPMSPSLVMWLATTMLGPLAPTAVLLLVARQRYRVRREVLLVASRLCFTAALVYMHYATREQLASALSLRFAALAQLSTAVCLPTRLSMFLPTQALHLLALLWTLGPHRLMVHAVQLFGFGLCLPCMLLYSLEVYARKGFLALTCAVSGAPQPANRQWAVKFAHLKSC